MHTPHRRGKGRTRILYWFRTPPGVRVGRAPLDEEAIRLIEHYHPNIRFNWPQILTGEEEKAVPIASPRRIEATIREPAASRTAPPEPQEPVSPAHARLGSEGLARLRARYADVLAAISQRVSDEVRRDQLKTEAERLNPDSWVTDAEVVAGLEQYESVLASLRDVVGRRRRRRRARPSPAPGMTGAERPPADGSGSETPDQDRDDGPETEPTFQK